MKVTPIVRTPRATNNKKRKYTKDDFKRIYDPDRPPDGAA